MTWPRHLTDLARGAGHLIWPPRCLVCSADLGEQTVHFCDPCRTALTHDPGDKCPRCASLVGPYTDLSDGCGRCRGTTFHFASAVRLGLYDGVVRDVVLAMKHESGELLAARLGQLWAETRRSELLQGDPQIVVPVPLHWRRRVVRGYNQSDELAAALAGALGLPWRRRTLVRVRPTPHQSLTRSAAERWRNLDAGFRARPGVAGLRVLLVDDVLTTGATAEAAAVALLAQGAAQVRVVVVAHR